MTPDDFRHQMRAFRTADPILRLFRAQVLPRIRGADLDPYLRMLMAKAKNLNEGLGALDEAIPLWHEVYAHNAPEGKEAVVRTLMAVASSRLGGRDPTVRADIPAAVRLYEATCALGHSADQSVRVVKTMMSAANRLSDTAGPASGMDLVGAVQLWTSAFRLHLSDDDRTRIVRTMMDIANRLSNVDRPDRIHVDGAVRVWRALAALDLGADGHARLRRTMMDVANRLIERGRVEDAVAIWPAVYAIDPDPDGRLRVLKTMMAAANTWTDVEGGGRNVAAALRVWDAAIALAPDASERTRVVATVMAVAGRLAEVDAVAEALQLWRGLAKHGEALSVQKALLARGSAVPELRGALLALLRADDPFDLPLLAGLLYYDERYDDVLALGARPDAPPGVRALHADALRKLRRYDEAIASARRLLDRPGDALEELDARVSALTCIGYCLLEQAKAGEPRLDEAEAHLMRARAAAADAGLPVPPRVDSGLGYVHQLQGRPDDAVAAFERARRADPGNAKATDALSTPAPQLRTRPFEDLPRITRHPQVLDGAAAIAGLRVAAALRRLAGLRWDAIPVDNLAPGDVTELLEYAARLADR